MDVQERIQLLKRVRTTILEMLQDRGYNTEEFPLNIDDEEMLNRYRNETLDLLIPMYDESHSMYVKFYTVRQYAEQKSFGKKELQTTVDEIREQYPDKDIHFIILLHQEPTTPAKKALKADMERYKHVEVYPINRFVFNITKHCLVPHHRKMSAEEITVLLDKYHCTRGQLPKMLSSDPISQYYHFQTGDVIEIIRFGNPSTGRYKTYRLVK